MPRAPTFHSSRPGQRSGTSALKKGPIGAKGIARQQAQSKGSVPAGQTVVPANREDSTQKGNPPAVLAVGKIGYVFAARIGTGSPSAVDREHPRAHRRLEGTPKRASPLPLRGARACSAGHALTSTDRPLQVTPCCRSPATRDSRSIKNHARSRKATRQPQLRPAGLDWIDQATLPFDGRSVTKPQATETGHKPCLQGQSERPPYR